MNSAQTDSFIRDKLPPPEQWPQQIYDFPPSVLDDILQPQLNLVTELLDKATIKGFSDRPLLRSPRITLTYHDVGDRVNRIAQVLTEDYGLVPGNRVLLRGGNSVGMALAWLAVVKAGLIAVATMPLLRASELGDIIEKAQPTLALCDIKLMEELEIAQTQHPVLKNILPFNVMLHPQGLATLSSQKDGSFTACPTLAAASSMMPKCRVASRSSLRSAASSDSTNTR